VVLLCKDHGNPTLLPNYGPIALCTSFSQLIIIIITSRIQGLTEKYAMLESSQHGFRGSRSVQLVIQKERWLLKQAMKQDTKLIRVDLDFKNAFNSAGHSSLWRYSRASGCQMCPYSAAFMNTLRCESRWAVSPPQQSSWTRERYRILPSPPSCSTSSSMPSCDFSTLLAFPIVYEVSPIGIIKPLPTISPSTSAQRTMPILCWIL